MTQTIATFNSTSTPSIERGGKLTARLALWHERLAAMLHVTDLVAVQNKHCPLIVFFLFSNTFQKVQRHYNRNFSCIMSAFTNIKTIGLTNIYSQSQRRAISLPPHSIDGVDVELKVAIVCFTTASYKSIWYTRLKYQCY